MAKKKERYRAAVIGAGSWGITLASVLYRNGHHVSLWEFDKKQAENLACKRKFEALEEYRIPKSIVITNSIRDAVDGADFIVISVPSYAIKKVSCKLSAIKLKSSAIIISTVKGFEPQTLKRPAEVLRDELGRSAHIVVLSGPSHAEEVIRKIPTAVVAASSNKKYRYSVQSIFSNVNFRVYTSSDLKGVELGGALKNVIAIASGISSGLGMGDNTRAALITRGSVEIARLGIRMGAKRDTFRGLSGVGDLIVTCFSNHSRNFRFGKLIGEGCGYEEAIQKINTTVEGVNTAKSVHKLAQKYKVQMPVCNKVYEILFKNKPAASAWKELMLRPLKSEDFDVKIRSLK